MKKSLRSRRLKTNQAQLQSIVCCVCGFVQSNANNYNYLIAWKEFFNDQDMHACMKCVRENKIQPTWIEHHERVESLSIGCQVLAKEGEEWLPGTVCQSYIFSQQCDVCWDDTSKPVSRKNYSEIRKLMTMNSSGQVTFKMYQYTSLENYLQLRGFDIGLDAIEVKEGFISQKIHNSFMQNLKGLELSSSTSFTHNFHPGFENTGLNLLHPSFFCYVQGTSIFKNGKTDFFDEKQQQIVVDYFGRSSVLSKYQWLPTNFYIGTRNTCTIQGYINALGYRYQHPELFDNIEKIFSRLVPMIESCLKKLYHCQKVDWRSMRDDNTRRKTKLKGEKIQAIVNLQNYVLEPGQSYEEEWRYQGIPQEHIIATAMYYCDVSHNIIDEGLQFRRPLRDEEEYQFMFEFSHENPPPFDKYHASVNIGSVQTKKYTCVVFPNLYQRKIVKLSNSSKSEVATMKILQFFIVDPEEKIISTQQIAYQNIDKIKGLVLLELQKSALRILGKCFCQRIVKKIMQNYENSGFSWYEAQLYGLELSRERIRYNDLQSLELTRNIQLRDD
eukprot:TRINITY_DN14734_c0_g1_i1.p1 TRINITY_DN14734_c0_g1~~TRINITY_DN14734_c0_g1_i1.p1  ORF type:complete len:555 (+),score=37.38 TRINITY_DN14734_c0_g1_i1:167-1831(+)